MKNELDNYSFKDFRNEILEGKNELMLRYNNNVYSIGVHGEGSLNLKSALNLLFKKPEPEPLFEFVDETNKKVLLIDKKETIVDKILINGMRLEEIWTDIEII